MSLAEPHGNGDPAADKPERDTQAQAISDGIVVPDVDGLTLDEAALAYAACGWYLLPTDPADIKSPGSVVNGRWHDKSSRDPEQIREWWTDYPDYGIALHCGRSGLIVLTSTAPGPITLRAMAGRNSRGTAERRRNTPDPSERRPRALPVPDARTTGRQAVW